MRIEQKLSQSLSAATTATSYSPFQDITHCVWVSGDIQVVTSGTGTANIQGSNDSIHWYDLGTSFTISGNGSNMWNLPNIGCELIRFRLTSTSGTISANFNLVAKGI